MGVDWWTLAIPWTVGGAWIVHAVLAWQRPYRVDLVGWLLLTGLPVVAIVLVVVSDQLPDEGRHGLAVMSTTGFGAMLLALEVAACWWAVLILECLLATIRHVRFDKVVRRAA